MREIKLDIGPTGRTCRPLPEFRYARLDRTTTEPDRLQQKFEWRERDTGGTEWRDVPIVLVENFDALDAKRA